ncbi:uncharacterized protein [Physcomitrium patens]|uniref:Coilin N-terminal domain-containing protein n=1 Tax=Physcomitrium patens TaxID=3218 RepID=A0A2K1KPX1_PHYPA|nr:uncharacterized protein LOC112281767 isoform X2 [Physcomitrium patens]PNR55843.1 hypothetical protein PHYPA_006740 [Physcomitrium patens]|eukprot:XP_024374411.1 uncharacterized protein LOC112281767 isoform X2 [Physcomitrella patens]
MFRQLAIRPCRKSSSLSAGKSSSIRLHGGECTTGNQSSSLHAVTGQTDIRSTMDMKKGVRIRLCFGDPDILTPQQVDQGLSKCWILVHNYILTIGQLAAHIAAKFDLQHSCREGLSLEMDGFALPPTELASLLLNSDIVSVKKQKKVDSLTPAPSTALHSREALPENLKAITKESKGPFATVHTSSSTSQMLQYAQPLPAPQPPQAPCPPTPTQTGGMEAAGPENGVQVPHSEEEKEDASDTSMMTVPGVLDVSGSDREVLAEDGIAEKSIVSGKEDTEEKNNVLHTDEPGAEKLQNIVTRNPLPDKRKFTTIFEPGVQQYKRTRIIGPHAMKSVAALRAALIGTARPKSPLKYRLQSEAKERSEKNYPEMWARKAFDAWRSANGHSTDLSIEDLSELCDVRPLVDMLCEFMSQLTKQNGQSYPPASIQAMLRAIGRIIRARELQRTAETGIAKVPFSIYRDPRFLRVKLAVEEAVAKSAAIESAKEVMTLEVYARHGSELEAQY